MVGIMAAAPEGVNKIINNPIDEQVERLASAADDRPGVVNGETARAQRRAVAARRCGIMNRCRGRRTMQRDHVAGANWTLARVARRHAHA
jgi:hypothetical protein